MVDDWKPSEMGYDLTIYVSAQEKVSASSLFSLQWEIYKHLLSPVSVGYGPTARTGYYSEMKMVDNFTIWNWFAHTPEKLK